MACAIINDNKLGLKLSSVVVCLLLMSLCGTSTQPVHIDTARQHLLQMVLQLINDLKMIVADSTKFECTFWQDVVMHANLCYADNSSHRTCNDYIFGYKDDRYRLPPLPTLHEETTTEYPQLCIEVGLVFNATDSEKPGPVAELNEPDVQQTLQSIDHLCKVSGDYVHKGEEIKLIRDCRHVQPLNTTDHHGDGVHGDRVNDDAALHSNRQRTTIGLLLAAAIVVLCAGAVLVWKLKKLIKRRSANKWHRLASAPPNAERITLVDDDQLTDEIDLRRPSVSMQEMIQFDTTTRPL